MRAGAADQSGRAISTRSRQRTARPGGAAGMSIVRSDHIVLAEPPWQFSLLDSSRLASLFRCSFGSNG